MLQPRGSRQGGCRAHLPPACLPTWHSCSAAGSKDFTWRNCDFECLMDWMPQYLQVGGGLPAGIRLAWIWRAKPPGGWAVRLPGDSRQPQCSGWQPPRYACCRRSAATSCDIII